MTAQIVAITVDEFLPHPIERVWKAINDPASLAVWLMESDFAPEVGHRFTLQAQPIPAIDFDGRIQCEVLAVEPPHLLRHTWTGGGLNTVLSYRLERAEQEGKAGTRLLLEHSGFDLSNPGNQFAYQGMGNGWQSKVVPGLRRMLDEQAAA